jgi:hypothetical protein
MRRLDDLHRPRQVRRDLAPHLRRARRRSSGRSCSENHVGAEDLVLEHFFQRVVVLDRRIGGALRLQRVGIVGERAGGDGGPSTPRSPRPPSPASGSPAS